MKRIIFRQCNKAIIIAVITLLIGTLFSSYLATDIFLYSVSARKLVEEQNDTHNLTKGEAYVRTGRKTNETGFTLKRINILSQEIEPEKGYLNNRKPDFETRWLFSLFCLYVAVALHLLVLSVREWLIKVAQSGCDFIVVHYIQLKDGKKNAVSPSYSF